MALLITETTFSLTFVEWLLPHGLEVWRQVALEYQSRSAEANLRCGEDLCDNWNKKLCNRMIEPTGKPGLIRDRIFCCIAIDHHILGVNSAESGYSGDNGESASSNVMEDGAEAADGGVAFQFSGEYEEGGEEDEEVAAATNAGVAEEEQGVSAAIDRGVNEAAQARSAEASEMACCLLSLPAFVSGGLSNVGQGSAVSS